jgi:Uma2 family endonuclease
MVMSKSSSTLIPGQISIGPESHGARMSLHNFDNAVCQDGFTYELNQGVIEATNFPHRRHFAQLIGLRNLLIGYQLSHPEIVHAVAGSHDSKVLIETEQSERHPDLAVYLSPMPDVDEIWSIWIPTIAVEIVSESSARRDYEEKPGEYLTFGIHEYWIVDGFKTRMTVLTRYGSTWREQMIEPSQIYSTSHLPGFTLDLNRIFAAGNDWDFHLQDYKILPPC